MRIAAVGILLAAWLSQSGVAGEPTSFRAARSVHLGYPAPDGELFYNELVVERSTPGSYFMACGWNTGYFGIQELADRGAATGSKVVIFSVWDPTRGDDPDRVNAGDRVEVLHEGKGVKIRRFGGEGTGGQCMAPLGWKEGQTNRFLLRGEIQGPKTAYTAWVWRAEPGEWWKLATFRVRTGGLPLKGYYSFIEDFRRDGKSVGDLRRARCQNGWVRDAKGAWTPLGRARFTASGADWESKDNIDAGLAGPGFFLATGGAITNRTALNSTLDARVVPNAAGPADLPSDR
jgi:hypothetical protein